MHMGGHFQCKDMVLSLIAVAQGGMLPRLSCGQSSVLISQGQSMGNAMQANDSQEARKPWQQVMLCPGSGCILVMSTPAQKLSRTTSISQIPPCRPRLSFAGAVHIQPGFIHFSFLNWNKRTEGTKNRNAYKG